MGPYLLYTGFLARFIVVLPITSLQASIPIHTSLCGYVEVLRSQTNKIVVKSSPSQPSVNLPKKDRIQKQHHDIFVYLC